MSPETIESGMTVDANGVLVVVPGAEIVADVPVIVDGAEVTVEVPVTLDPATIEVLPTNE